MDWSIHHFWQCFWCDFLALRCVNCAQKSAPPLCLSCAEQLPHIENRCECCGKAGQKSSRCENCKHNPPPLDKLISRWQYGEAVQQWFWRAKFHADRAALQILSDEAVRLSKWLYGQDFSAIIPMPIAPQRLRQRGFNQTIYPARAVAKTLSLPLITTTLWRENRPQQAKLSSDFDRFTNIAGAFYLGDTPPERILLIDDIFTTGATMFEAAKVLKLGGAQYVTGMVLAMR